MGGIAAAIYNLGLGIHSPLTEDFAGARRYAAREYKSDELYYYRNRYYDSTLQRFLSEDRQGFAGGDHNLYGYVGNNPANFTNPSGNWTLLIPIIWAGVEAGLSIYDTYQTVTDPCLGLGDKLTAGGLLAAGVLRPGGLYSKADDVARKADNYVDLASMQRRKHVLDGDVQVEGIGVGLVCQERASFLRNGQTTRLCMRYQMSRKTRIPLLVRGAAGERSLKEDVTALVSG